MAVKKGTLSIDSENIFPIIKKWVYSDHDIFARELVSNGCDAITKLKKLDMMGEYELPEGYKPKIEVIVNPEEKTMKFIDNGLGMTAEEVEEYITQIAFSGATQFLEKYKDKTTEDDMIGHFGLGFYSAFMVSDKVTVESKSYKDDKATIWESAGVDGYTLSPSDKKDNGTIITLHLKEDTEDYNYSELLSEYKLRGIIKKYSDYISYPIKMEVENNRKKEDSDEYETYKEVITINSMIPLWKRNKKDITEEEYNNFYSDKFFDYDKPLDVLHFNIEGNVNYNALLYIPSHAPYDYYSKEYEKGLQLYTNGVLIMDKCSELLPDYFSFVRGVIDTEDIPLNISRETLQDDKNIKLIAKSIESKVKNELLDLLKNNRDKYLEFYKAFGMQLKFGIYNDYGMHKDKLEDLIMFYSSGEKKLITLDEYVNKLKEEDKNIYYCAGETVDKIDMLPQVEGIKDKHEVLYLTDYVDEFAIMAIHEYKGKTFVNVTNESTDLSTDEEKEKINKENTDNKDMLEEMKKVLEGNVEEVKLTNKLKSHPVCLTTTGEVSTSMEKVINAMPTDEKIKANEVLEINASHKIVDKLKDLYKNDKDEFTKYTKVIYYEARLIEGLPIDNPTELSNLMCDIMANK